MTTTGSNGRFCNQLVRNLAVSLIAERHNLYVNYCSGDLIKVLGINLFCGRKRYNNNIELTDDNYFEVYNRAKLNSNLMPNNSYFQTKKISNFLVGYLRANNVKPAVIAANPFKIRYNTNNDVCIHIRLTDVAEFNPGINYYLKILGDINFEKLFITSDDLNHSIIAGIMDVYPNTILIDCDIIKSIQFASTCKNVILSHGSFSAVIGYLSYFSVVHYPEYENNKIWYGDLFSIDGWIKHSV
jgi:hypothetical protein